VGTSGEKKEAVDRTDAHQKTLEQMGEELYRQKEEGLEECLSSLDFGKIATPKEKMEVTNFIRKNCPEVLNKYPVHRAPTQH
jgi:hypothetical protein